MSNALSTSQVARRLQLTNETVLAYVKAGKLPALRLAGVYRFLESDLDTFIDSHKSK